MLQLSDLVLCSSCGGVFHSRGESVLACKTCGRAIPIVNGIARFVSDDTHENFAIQWKRFWDVQLDSRNGSQLSRERLLDQSELAPADFDGRIVLEVGCGAGRFTEIILSLGARDVAVDYSRAVEACVASNEQAITEGRLYAAQADIFDLPFKAEAFDIVVCYGVLQHTGDARTGLAALWRHVKPGGLLLVDHYQLSVRNTLPLKYLLRPLLRRRDPEQILGLAQTAARRLYPVQKTLLANLRGRALPKRLARYALHRSLTTTYPIMVELEGKIDSTFAQRWVVLDTFDEWAPRFDRPWTFARWKRELQRLPGAQALSLKSGGQGNIAVLRKAASTV